ncbi:MAG: hypothetical protein U0941_14360 [Planctomycetaceae bacterium]
MKANPFCSLMACIVLLLPSLSTCGADQDRPDAGTPDDEKLTKTSRVAAQVIMGESQPERRSGLFTIPKDTLGVDLQFRYRDPNTGYSSTTLKGSNLYSITQNRFLRELESVPIYHLPPGDYRFEVGGTPGSGGELTVTIAPGTPLTVRTGTGTTNTSTPDTRVTPTVPTKNKDVPPATPLDEEATIKALDRAWSGIYTIDRITGPVDGLGEVKGKRAIGVTFRRTETGIAASGAVWMPPGWNGNAGGGIVEPGGVILFHVQSKLLRRGALSIYYKGLYDPKSDSIRGTLIGYMPKGESSEAVFEGTWYLKPR